MATRHQGLFDNRSRYFRVPEQVAPDRRGRPRLGKALRLLPTPPGRLEHVVEGGDRLDHLAYKYYRKSRHFWHVLDANPDVLNPLNLLGEGPERSVAFELSFAGHAPPWAELFRTLRERPGVMDTETVGNTPTRVVSGGTLLFELAPALLGEFPTAVSMQTLPAALEAALASEGLVLAAPLVVERTSPTSFSLQAANGRVYEARLTPASPPDPERLSLFELDQAHLWTVTLHYNTLSVSSDELRGEIEAAGFSVESTTIVSRVGKTIAIPARAS